jgi:alanine dehydrogenase
VSELLVLSRRDLAALMRFGDYVEAVAEGFRLHLEIGCAAPLPMEIAANGGAFHVKAASLPRGSGYVAVKINANFPENPRRRDLPTIQGAVLLSDATDGTPLALLDSGEITMQRTGAATAIAARYLAPPGAEVATICGCGVQGRIQLVALRHVLDIKRVYAWDIEPSVAAAYARRMSQECGIEVVPATTLRAATRASQAIVTCTSSAVPFLDVDDVAPGTFIAAIGADNPRKSEIRPVLMAHAKVVADIGAQCAVMGDLHHAIRAGAMRASDIHGELGELIAGRKHGREREDEITLFDGTGTGIQDVAASACAYEKARERGVGSRCRLG